jgi:hypothetical protein
MVKSKIKILYLTWSYKHHSSASYQPIFIKYMKKYFDVNIFEMAISYLKIEDPKALESEKHKVKNSCVHYDILIFGHDWLGDHPFESIIPLDNLFLFNEKYFR